MDQNVAETAAILARQGVAPREIGPGWYTHNAALSLNDFEHTLPYPRRKRERAELHTAESFILYVKRHAKDPSTIITLDRVAAHSQSPVFSAILNYHPSRGAMVIDTTTPAKKAAVEERRTEERSDQAAPSSDWCDHVATYPLPFSHEWKAWSAQDGKPMEQEPFALFLEDNIGDVRAPSGATMLQLATGLVVKKSVEFEQGVRLSDGQTQLTYGEKISGTVQQGNVKIPQTFTLGIPVFLGGAAYAVNARLRYRIDGNKKLFLWYVLDRPWRIVEDAVLEAAKEIEKETGYKILHGRIDGWKK